jgi:indolepyruvate ferredoxin oxidoreductase
VARYYFKLMAYKDEYEVARLYTSGDFLKRVQNQFEGNYTLHFNLAPPLFSRRDPNGHLLKAEYGPWMLKAFGLLKHFKGLRGGKLDLFGYTEERRTERALIEEYRQTIGQLLAGLEPAKLDLAVEIARVPEQIRGFGHVKEAHLKKARSLRDELLTRWHAPAEAEAAAA